MSEDGLFRACVHLVLFPLSELHQISPAKAVTSAQRLRVGGNPKRFLAQAQAYLELVSSQPPRYSLSVIKLRGSLQACLCNLETNPKPPSLCLLMLAFQKS